MLIVFITVTIRSSSVFVVISQLFIMIGLIIIIIIIITITINIISRSSNRPETPPVSYATRGAVSHTCLHLHNVITAAMYLNITTVMRPQSSHRDSSFDVKTQDVSTGTRTNIIVVY